VRRLIAATALVVLIAPAADAQGFTMRVSGDIVVPRGTVQEGSAIVMNGRIQVDGTLRGDALAMNGDVTVSGTVTGSVRTFNGDIVLASTAVVGGDVWSASGRVDRAPGAQVRGRVQGALLPPPAVPPAPARPRLWGRRWTVWWPGTMRAVATWTLLSFVVLAAVLAAVFPAQIRRVAEVLHRSPGEALLAGVGLWLLLPPLAMVLALSIVGLPVVAFLPFAVLVIGLVGFAGASQLIGDRVLGGSPLQRSDALAAVVGAVLLGVLAFIPGLGWLGIAVAFTWGIGGVLVAIWRGLRAAASPAAS